MEPLSESYETLVVNEWFNNQLDRMLLEGADFALYTYTTTVEDPQFNRTVWRISTGELRTVSLGKQDSAITEQTWDEGIPVPDLVYVWDITTGCRNLTEECVFIPLEFIPNQS